ncbi:unnamed protein product [Arabis nemorensis]|uniref:Uncharacterized protein n=1 Tax=Arabis nemorensis TaxID=586526 RepID=A0A565CHZ7_9BRAS|nr:unnamed protein product [Arabis nemorensis]
MAKANKLQEEAKAKEIAEARKLQEEEAKTKEKLKERKLVEEATLEKKRIQEKKFVDEYGGKEKILKPEEWKLPEVVYPKPGLGTGTKSGSEKVGEVVKAAEEKLGYVEERDDK